jgi:hypothetical protein
MCLSSRGRIMKTAVAARSTKRLTKNEGKMAKVKIEKFVDEEHERSLRLPVTVLAIAQTFLPRSALDSLARKGLDVREILDTARNGTGYSKTVYVREHGVSKKIVVSLI